MILDHLESFNAEQLSSSLAGDFFVDAMTNSAFY